MDNSTDYPNNYNLSTLLIVQMYLNENSISSISRKTGLKRYVVSKILKTSGVTIRESTRRLPLNVNAFKDANNNPEAAYWIGVLGADGCIGTKPPQHTAWYVQLSLSGEDGKHVFAFRDFLKSGHACCERQPPSQSRARLPKVAISVVSTTLVESLLQYGLTPRKSKTFEVIGLENNRDFWRGMWDGDGHISIVPANKKRNEHVVMKLCGSQRTIEQFLAFASSTINTIAKPCKKSSIWEFCTKGAPAVRLAHLLYKDAVISLPRKKAVADEVMRRFRASDGLPNYLPERHDYSHITAHQLSEAHLRLGTWAAVDRELGLERPGVAHELAEAFGLTASQKSRWGKKIEAFGETKTVSEWLKDKRCQATREIIWGRLYAGLDPERAIAMPPASKSNRTRDPKTGHFVAEQILSPGRAR